MLLYGVRCTLSTVRGIEYDVHYTLYIIYTVRRVYYTIVQCTLAI